MKKCPMCSKEANKENFPFCSDRCKKVDLGKWLNESYVVSTPAVHEEQEEEINLQEN